MITDVFMVTFSFAIIFGAVAVGLLAYGIYKAIIEYDFSFFFGTVCGFLFLSSISNFFFYEAYKEYQNAIPQNQ